jgi:hypothetical protein
MALQAADETHTSSSQYRWYELKWPCVQTYTFKALIKVALHGAQESFTSERFGQTLYSFIRLASAVSFASIGENEMEIKHGQKKLMDEMRAAKLFGLGDHLSRSNICQCVKGGQSICLPNIKDFSILASKSSISCLFF